MTRHPTDVMIAISACDTLMIYSALLKKRALSDREICHETRVLDPICLLSALLENTKTKICCIVNICASVKVLLSMWWTSNNFSSPQGKNVRHWRLWRVVALTQYCITIHTVILYHTTISHCIVSHCLCHTTLFHALWYHTVLHYPALYHTVLCHSIISQCVLCHNILCHTVLYHAVLY